jgi:hypothetical protein
MFAHRRKLRRDSQSVGHPTKAARRVIQKDRREVPCRNFDIGMQRFTTSLCPRIPGERRTAAGARDAVRGSRWQVDADFVDPSGARGRAVSWDEPKDGDLVLPVVQTRNFHGNRGEYDWRTDVDLPRARYRRSRSWVDQPDTDGDEDQGAKAQKHRGQIAPPPPTHVASRHRPMPSTPRSRPNPDGFAHAGAQGPPVVNVNRFGRNTSSSNTSLRGKRARGHRIGPPKQPVSQNAPVRGHPVRRSNAPKFWRPG